MLKFMTAREAADQLGLSVGYVTSHLLQTGTIKAEKVDGRWVVDRASVEAYKPPVNTRPEINKTRIIPVKDTSSKEENRAAIERQMEAVRSGKVKPLILERGVSSL